MQGLIYYFVENFLPFQKTGIFSKFSLCESLLPLQASPV